MVLIRPIAELYALQQLLGDIRIAGSGAEGWEPVEPGENSILDCARLHMARPTDDARHPEAALITRSFSPFEWRHAAVRPGEHLRAVVGCEYNDGIVSLPNIIQMLQERANGIIHLRHGRFFKPVVGLWGHHGIVLFREKRPQVRAGGVVPDEERFPILLGLVIEITRRLRSEFVVSC